MWYDASSNSWTGAGSEKHAQFYNPSHVYDSTGSFVGVPERQASRVYDSTGSFVGMAERIGQSGGAGPSSSVVGTSDGGGGAGPASDAVVSRRASGVPERSSGLVLEIGNPSKVTQLVTAGRPMRPDAGWSDGQKFEDRWGEWGGAIGGLFVMGADLMNDNIRVPAAEYREKHGIPDKPQGGNALKPVFDWFQEVNAINGSATLGSNGVVYRTGGGF